MNASVQTSGSPALEILSDADLLSAARAEWKATPHPLLPWFSDAELLQALRRPAGPETVAQLFAEREERIFMSGEDGDPLRFSFELPNWSDADAMLREYKFLYVAGGKRASKSEWAAKRFVQSALKYPRGILWAFQDNAKTGIATQQRLIWKYLPPEIKALNGKLDKRRIWSINYTPKNGFADGVLVLPNRTTIYFLTYEMEVTDYQGWEIGAVVLQQNQDPNVPNIGFWADENMPLPWMETCEFRATSRNAKGIWTFSTTEGITPTIKQILGTAVTLETRPAELLSGRINLPNLPVGHMPYQQQAERSGWAAVFFFSEFNPFGNNYANVKEICKGKNGDFIMENAYGYARDTKHKAFPLFGEWNVIRRDQIPRHLTRYMLTDPGDASRNWATIWVGIDSAGRFYIYRDWPDCQSYGEWAVPSDDPRQPDGNRGPAQRSLGFGTTQLAEEWRRLESQVPADEIPQKAVVLPHDGKLRQTPVRELPAPAMVSDQRQPREEIFERYIDPRAASNPHIEQHGGTNLYQKFAELPDPMIFTAWSGVEKSIGYSHINTLLYWDRKLPLCWPDNAPKLYVCEDCEQVRWMFSNFTGLGGDKAGGKDFADLVRGMALADLQFYETNEFQSRGPGKGY